MRKRAVIVHINAWIGVIPLVGGYLKAFALADQEIAANRWSDWSSIARE